MSTTRVLFVCLGNICRSPMAEAIFRHKVALAGLADSFQIDSAGTGNWHVGENPDPRTIRVLRENDITEFSRARQVRSSDFEEYDFIVAMDFANVRDLSEWQGARTENLSLMSSWDPASKRIEVPDPYYGGHEDFVEVFKMLDQSSAAMLEKLRIP